MAAERITTSIIDPATGKPATYDRAILTSEISAPTTTGIRSILTEHPSAGLDPARLASILRQAENGDARAQWELAEDIEEKYLHYQGQLGTRKRAVSQLDITIEAASDDPEDVRNADFLREWLQRDTLEDEFFDILDAIGKGVSFTEVVWDITPKTWVPERLETRAGQWFQYDLIDGKTPRLIGGADGNSSLPEDLPPFKFIVHQHPAKTGAPLKGGLIRGVAWAYLFQAMTWRDWVIFAEVYGMPMRVGKYGPGATEDERRTLLRAVASLATDAAAIIPQSMMIEFQNAAAGGDPEMFERLITKLDDGVSKATVGQTGTADAKAQGIGSGSADVHNEVRGDIKRADAKKLAATLNRQVFRPMIDLNYGPPASGRYPKCRIGQPEQFTKDDLDILEGLVEMGVEIEASIPRDKAGYPDPPEKTKDGKPVKLLRPRAQAAPQNPPQDGQDPGGAPIDRQTAASRSERVLRPLKSLLKTDPSPPAPSDAIDTAVDALDGDWEEVLAPLSTALAAEIAAASSYDDLRDRLKKLADLPQDQLTDLLSRSTFSAALAGHAGLKLDGEA